MTKLNMYNLIYFLTMTRSKIFIKAKYGSAFWKKFKRESDEMFHSILTKIPDIGESAFSLSYKFGPGYITWYKAFIKSGINQEETISNIWMMNEKLITTIPKFIRPFFSKTMVTNLRKEAKNHIMRQELHQLHPNDWEIEFRDLDKNSFEIDIKTCGLKKLASDFKAEGLLPGVCRLDFLAANLMGFGFIRTKTLGDGDDCCNCHYALTGNSEWAPEKGFEFRK